MRAAFALSQCSLRFGQACALRGQIALQLDALARLVLPGVAGHVAFFGQLGDVSLALAGDRHSGFELGDQLACGADLGLAAVDLRTELGELGCDVVPLGLLLRLGRGRVGCGPVGREGGLGPWLAGRERREDAACAQRVRLRGLDLFVHAGLVGAGNGGVQLHQRLAGLHLVAVLHQHALDNAALQRLHQLGPLAHDDAALRDGDDVDLAEDRPEQGDGERAP